MNKNRFGETVYYDKETGEEYVLDADGNKRPPMQLTKTLQTSGFTYYDNKNGHCSFCGRLTCNGRCFK